jgi:hypothetical protein
MRGSTTGNEAEVDNAMDRIVAVWDDAEKLEMLLFELQLLVLIMYDRHLEIILNIMF